MKRIPGVVVGIVKDLNDRSGQGRINLEFSHLPNGQRSGWAPVAAALAGKNRGAFFMPEIDDEVLVAFQHGDFNHPYIVGFLWNGVDTPPESDHKNRVIVTPGGHTLRFEDGDNKKVILQSNSGHKIKLDDSSGSESLTLETKGNQSVILDDEAKTITLKTGDQSVTLDDTAGSITLKGGQRILEMSSGMVKIS
jgi:uncharacterized protein involved in type VI secretion and phage assembly